MYLRGNNVVFKLMVLSQLDDFIKYLNEVEHNLWAKADDYIKKAEALHEDEQENYWDWHVDEYHDYSELYPSFLRNSIFISIYSYLEYHLLNQCDNKEKLRSIKGSGIEKGKKYFKQVYGIHTPFESIEWNNINDYNKIRNCLVHNGGDIDNISNANKQKELNVIINKIPTIELSNRGQILIQKEFCIEFCEVVKCFLTLTVESRKSIE
ncbi:hypothetical protein JYA63_03395 [Fictibacillus nanhaiensis]|uniref:RiboL-PSP-HEPN domain-containing protein n=1 Tax=Fictibacillus nanhaiensis TaxID=742169 RepID=A0ABS2ZPH2_9BACL|nr:hypothetical protein [Fictibacillus nanhaiensis]